jgi:5-methylthioribose kinase
VDRRRVFAETFPRGFFVDPESPGALESYLRERSFLHAGESLASATKAGEGNMNLTLRVVTTSRSFVLKQARPWVEKYPQIEAPAGRARVETAFYETIASREALRSAMPALLGADPDSGILLLEDLGEAQDFTSLYRGKRLPVKELSALVSYLVELHRPFPRLDRIFENRDMRALNHEHIFRLPLAPDNGLDLDAFTPGLGEAARSLKEDGDYVSRVTALGREYLEDGPVLAHGDYFPGSWLHTSRGVRVIDPEFCFLGSPEFDVGVMLAHLHLSGAPEEAGDDLLRLYRESAGGLDSRARRYAGVEIMRRLIGVAQLPLNLGIEEKRSLLEKSRALVLSP